MSRNTRVGFFLPSPNVWMGGVNYYLRLIVLLSEASKHYTSVVFLSDDSDRSIVDKLSLLQDVELVYINSTRQSLKGLLMALFIGKDKNVEALAIQHEIDVFYSNATFFGWKFKTPTLSWVPDLQHLYLPRMFSFFTKLKRNVGFLLQASFSTGLIFSSNDAKQSFKKNYPTPNKNLYVVRFAVKPICFNEKEITEVKIKYQLDNEYIFLPNQYWPHKNHLTVIKAIYEAKINNDKTFQIVSSGSKDSSTFDSCFDLIKDLNITQDEYKILGLIPGEDVIKLMAGSAYVLNPSLFEGWSTSVEEAKCLNKKMILSDIPIHREQEVGTFCFFQPNDSNGLAKLISKSNQDTFVAKTEVEIDYQNRFFEEVDLAIKSVIVERNI